MAARITMRRADKSTKHWPYCTVLGFGSCFTKSAQGGVYVRRTEQCTDACNRLKEGRTPAVRISRRTMDRCQ